MKNSLEKSSPPEKEQEPTLEQVTDEMAIFLTGLQEAVNDKQEELKKFLALSNKEQEHDKIQALKQEIKELNKEVEKMKETLEFIDQEGDDLEMKIIKKS
ncbi:hypothetical protein IID20_03000 [Patescibacteria group bacterium]|nr:hypothetical protein [Patescibacteria group bacterium]